MGQYFEMDQEVDGSKIEQISCEGGDDHEVEYCELMFSAIPNMTPYLARDERLWTYMTHTVLLDYSRERWPIPQDKEKAMGHIRTHFFVTGARGIERDNAASRLWWMAHIISLCESLPLKDGLQYFFRSDVRANIIGRPTTAQNPIIITAILEKLNESYHGDQRLYNRETFRNFMIELNLFGGVSLLDSFDRDMVNSLLDRLAAKPAPSQKKITEALRRKIHRN